MSKTNSLPGKTELLRLYERMLILRDFELSAQAMYKKGEMPGFIHLYVGQEAVATGICAHLTDQDWITSTHRGHGHALAKGMLPRVLMAELYAKETGCCGGRGGRMHLYDPEHGVYGTNGIVAAGIPHAVGAGMSARLRGKDSIGVAFFGDGGANHGAFHESINFAGAQNAPVVFVCENNLYATETPITVATKNPDFASRAAAYGIPGVSVDGNDVIGVWKVMKEAAERARTGGGPTLIEARTYRTVGHYEGEVLVGTYRTQEELDEWKAKCPINKLRTRLLKDFKSVTEAELAAIENSVKATIAEAVEFARQSPQPDVSSFSLHTWSEGINDPDLPLPAPDALTTTTGWLDAVRDGIAEEMRRNPHTFYFGEGIGKRGGSFAHTKGLFAEFGGHRVIDTPISELGFTGTAIGASATGARTIADLMFVDFLFETGGQLPLQASKLRYMSNGRMAAPVIFRAACGAVRCAGPHHSGTYHSMWAHLPGLIVVMPSNPADAKGLMKSALRGRDPVVFLEPKGLFATKGQVPTGEYYIPFGVASVPRAGTDLTLVAAGRMVGLSLEAAEILAKEGVSVEVIDLRTIAPLDVDTIVRSVEKTGRILVVDEGYAMCGVGGEVAAVVNELAFDSLDAPIGRLQMEPVSHPLNPLLEAETMPTVQKIAAALRDLKDGRVAVASRASVWRPGKAGASEEMPKAGTPAPVSVAPAPSSSDKADEKSSPPAEAPAGGQPILLPHGDLTVSEATVVRWIKDEGDKVAKGEGVVEVETDKAVLEVESPCDGTIARHTAKLGDVVPMGGELGLVLPQ